MFVRSPWAAFVAGLGLLCIVASNGAGPDGSMSYPMLVGGIIIAAAGGFFCLRKRR